MGDYYYEEERAVLFPTSSDEELEEKYEKGEKGDKGDPFTYADMTEANKDDIRQPIYDNLLSLIYAGL